jgi:hypothetical protein
LRHFAGVSFAGFFLLLGIKAPKRRRAPKKQE